MPESTRILLVGYYGKGNFGDDVLLKTAHGIVRRLIPKARIYVILDKKGDYVRDMLKADIEILRPRSEGYGVFDAIVHGGGGVFFDFRTWGLANRLAERVCEAWGWKHYLKAQALVRRVLCKPLTSTPYRIGLGIGVGTYSSGSKKLRKHSLPLLADFTALWLRDPESQTNLERFRQLMHAEVVQGSDMAFLTEHWLPPSLLKPRGLAGKKKLGIVLRDWPYAQGSAHLKEVPRMLERLSSAYDITGYIFDHSADSHVHDMLSSYPLHVWRPDTMQLEDFAKHLHAQDVLLSSRAHGVICGACVGVPSVAVNIEPKLEQVHRMLPNATVIASAESTEDWPSAIQKAATISDDAIKHDLQQNHKHSENALAAVMKHVPIASN